MTNLLYFALAIVLIVIIARYNESKQLFWTLLVSFMLGAIGGALYEDYHSNTENKAKSVQTTSMQMSDVNIVGLLPTILNTSETQANTANSAGKMNAVRDNRHFSHSASKCTEDIRTQQFEPFDTS